MNLAEQVDNTIAQFVVDPDPTWLSPTALRLIRRIPSLPNSLNAVITAPLDRALAGHPLLRALWGCFKPPRCAADGVLRPTRAACPAGVEL